MFDGYKNLYYPYTIGGRQEYLLVKDISTNVRFVKDSVTNGAYYNIIDLDNGDTPERIAEQFYRNPELAHTVMLTNELYDIKEDFPLTHAALEQHIREKYANPFGVHHYEDVYGNIIQENNVEMRPFYIDVACVDAEEYDRGILKPLVKNIKHLHYAGEKYSHNVPEIFNKYPDVDVIRGEMGESNKHITVRYTDRCISFTLMDDEVLSDCGEEYSVLEKIPPEMRNEKYLNGRFQIIRRNRMVNANLFEKSFKGEVPAGMLSVWKKIDGVMTKTDMAWNNISAEPGDTIEIRTNTDWMPLPTFATYSFSSVNKRFPLLCSEPGVPAIDISMMFYPEENGKMLGNPLRRVPSMLFDANPQVIDASYLFAACIDIEYDAKTGKAGIPKDILVPFKNLQKADHFAQCVNVPLNLFITSPNLTAMDYVQDYDRNLDGDDIHAEAGVRGERYGAVEAFFNEIPWNKSITNTVHILNTTGKNETYNAFIQQSIHLAKTRQDKVKQFGGFASLSVYSVKEMPEFRTIRDATPYLEGEESEDDLNYKAMYIIPITNREYEIRLNDEKRRIVIIHPNMIDTAEKNLEAALEDIK